MTLSVMTWNINSVRLRLDLLQEAAVRHDPDVICLQETKVRDDLFPAAEIAGMGYAHQAILGEKGYNGVAILSRLPIAEQRPHYWCGKQDCRHLAVRLENGITIHNLYVPAGGDVPDSEQNPKFAHKLQFLDELTDFFSQNKPRKSILVGDLNIAPSEYDVWSHRQLLKIVSHTPVEVEALERLYRAGGWVDAVRHIIPEPEKIYSWWSYRARDWRKGDRGRRLDHVWVSPDLSETIDNVLIDREARGWEKPSDHVPVRASFALG